MSMVRFIPLPVGSALHQRRAPGDFLDCYAVNADTTPRATILLTKMIRQRARATRTLGNAWR